MRHCYTVNNKEKISKINGMLAGDSTTEKNKSGEEGGVLGPSSYKPGESVGLRRSDEGPRGRLAPPVLSNRALTRIVPGHL